MVKKKKRDERGIQKDLQQCVDDYQGDMLTPYESFHQEREKYEPPCQEPTINGSQVPFAFFDCWVEVQIDSWVIFDIEGVQSVQS